MRWLRDVHLPRLPAKYKSAVIVGNEDYPDRIEVYDRRDSHVTDVPVIFKADDEGVFKETKQSGHHATLKVTTATARRNHATKKSGTQLDREINDILVARQKREARTAKASPPSRSGAPSQAEYERRELADAHKKIDDLRRSPLADRKEAQAEFLKAMREDPELVAERIGWLLNGSYGYGSMQLAKRVLGSPRMNRSAALTQMVGAFEWQSPEDMTRAAWKKLSASEKAALERAVQGEITSAQSEE
ncbi:MAG: hypothetical protein M3619_28845 [Myxococcota bacterium]|nr:hypothetical protein [Myxococcota bacterium]